jgi:hypothetical protein
MNTKDEQRLRIQELGRRIREISAACSPGAEEQSLFSVLSQNGHVLLSPEELDEEQLHSKLWEVIHGLADCGVFLHHTDHLSDRELYEFLWCDALLERVKLVSDNPVFYHDIDGTESGPDEFQVYLKYYADENERRQYANDSRGLEMPDHVDPPYDRDRMLP